MTTIAFNDIEKMAVQLGPAERLRLAEALLRSLHSVVPEGQPKRRKWSEIRGMVPHPYFGEDAQSWITRGRMEEEQNGRSKEDAP